VTLQGLPLEDLTEAEHYLAGLTHDRLTAIAKESPDPARTWGEIVGAIEAAYSLVGRLWVDLSSSGSAWRSEEWADVQTAAAAARDRLTSAEPSRDERMSTFREVLAFVLALDPDVVDLMRDGPNPDRDRQDVLESLAQMRTALDRLERAINHRGGWPR
jgi:hypothetical protein